MRRHITTIILTLLTVSSIGQHSRELKPFVDDHKIFTHKDKSLGFINLDKYDKAWKFTIDQFDSKTVVVKQINDSLLNSCNDSTALTILKSWYRLSVDTVSVKHIDNIYDITLGLNNTYNEDKSGIFGTIYLNIILLYDKKTNKKKVTSIKYLTMAKYDN